MNRQYRIISKWDRGQSSRMHQIQTKSKIFRFEIWMNLTNWKYHTFLGAVSGVESMMRQDKIKDEVELIPCVYSEDRSILIRAIYSDKSHSICYRMHYCIFGRPYRCVDSTFYTSFKAINKVMEDLCQTKPPVIPMHIHYFDNDSETK